MPSTETSLAALLRDERESSAAWQVAVTWLKDTSVLEPDSVLQAHYMLLYYCCCTKEDDRVYDRAYNRQYEVV